MTLGMVFYGFKNHPPLYHCRTAFDYCNADQLYSCDHRCCVIFVLDKSPAAIAVLVILGIVSTILAVFVQMWYALALYLLLDHPQMKARESLKISRQIMKGNKGRLFYIYLSFIGLQILCLLSLGIGSLWYIHTSHRHWLFLSGCGRGDPIKHKLMLRLIAGY